MERITDLKDIATLLGEVEKGGANEHILRKLSLFPDIRGNNYRKRTNNVKNNNKPKNAGKRNVNKRNGNKAKQYANSPRKNGKSSSLMLQHIPLPKAQTINTSSSYTNVPSKYNLNNNSIPYQNHIAASSTMPTSYNNNNFENSLTNDKFDALSMLEANESIILETKKSFAEKQKKGKKSKSSKTSSEEEAKEALLRAQREKYRDDFFAKILTIDVKNVNNTSHGSLYGFLRAKQADAEDEDNNEGFISPESRRPVEKDLEKKVLSTLIPTKKYQWNNNNEGSSDYVYKNAKLHKTQPKQKVISDADKTSTPQIDLISTWNVLQDNTPIMKRNSTLSSSSSAPNIETFIDGSSFYEQHERVQNYIKKEKRKTQINSKLKQEIATNNEREEEKYDFFTRMEELSVLNSLIEQRDLIDKLGEEQREERVEKRNLDYAVVNKIEKLRNALPMDFLFEVGLKGAYDKKVKAKIRKIITNWAYGLESQGLRYWKRYVRLHRKDEKIRKSIDIQRVWRGYKGRKRFIKVWWLREVYKEKLRFEEFMLERKRWLSAIMIQKHWRGLLGRRRYAIERELIDSVIMIQRTWRAKKARMLTIMLRHRKEQREDAALKIEKCFRGHKGRKRAKRERHLQRREAHEKLLESKEYVLLYSFKKEGASRILQRWWRNSASSRMKFLGHEYTTNIQRVYRGYCGRKIFKRKRFEKLQREEEKEYERIAIKLQAIYRGKRGKIKTHEMLMAKIKHQEELAEKKRKYLEKKNSKSLGKSLSRRFSMKKGASKKKQEEAAICIQCAYRIKRAKRRVKKMRYIRSQWNRHKSDMSALQIQRIWRGSRGRKYAVKYRRDKYATVIQAHFRGNRDRTMLRNRMRYDMAIPTIQRYTRGWLARQLVKRMRFERKNLIVVVTRCQSIVRQYIGRHKAERQREFMHAKFEIKTFVTQRFAEAMIYECDRMILRLGFPISSKHLKILERKVADPGCSTSAEAHRLCEPLRDLYLFYSKPASSMESMKFLNAVKQMSGLIESKKKKSKKQKKHAFKTGGRAVNAMEVDLSFAKAIGIAKKQAEEEALKQSKQRGPAKKKIVKGVSFQGFCIALSLLADIRYAIRNEKGTITDYYVKNYRFHTGQRARFFKLIDEHVLAGTSKKLPGFKYRKKLDKYLKGRANWAANRIQRCVRGFWGRSLFAITKRNYHIHKENQIKGKKLACLQRRWRRRQARRLLIEKYRNTVKKYIDPVSKLPYWHNPKCNSVRWKKIKWLRRGIDVRTVIELPDPDIEFVKLCDQCNDLTVSFYCVDCDDFYCKNCFDSFHSKGKRKSHAKFPIECCVECEYQIGSRECHQCGDFYCDTCYWKAHSQGALMQHTCEPLIPLCKSCEDQEKANAVRVDCGGDQMCKRCYNSWYYPQGYECYELPLETRSMREFREKLLRDREAEREKEEKIKREKREERWRVIEAVKKIQGLYRMKKARRLWYPVILNAQEARIARERREGKANAVKGSMRYKMLSFLGRGDVLETDSHEERVRKLIPLELYESELREKFEWLTEEDIEKSKYVGERLTGLAKTQADAKKTAEMLKAAMNGENAELVKQKSIEAAKLTAKLTGKVAAKILGVEEGKIGEAAVRNAKKARKNAINKLIDRRKGLNESIGEGLKDLSRSMRLAGIGGRLADFVAEKGSAARKKARKIERGQIRQIKFDKRLKAKLQERADLREKDAQWELVPDDGYGTGEYWYNNETGESNYDDPRTFGDEPDDMDDIKEEVEEEMTEEDSDAEDSSEEEEEEASSDDDEKPAEKDSKWKVEYDDENTPYYYTNDGESTYTKPDDYDGPDENAANATAAVEGGNDSGWESSYENYGGGNGANDWQEAYDDDGNVYYYNSNGETTYDYPW